MPDGERCIRWIEGGRYVFFFDFYDCTVDCMVDMAYRSTKKDGQQGGWSGKCRPSQFRVLFFVKDILFIDHIVSPWGGGTNEDSFSYTIRWVLFSRIHLAPLKMIFSRRLSCKLLLVSFPARGWNMSVDIMVP